jgi:two-component system CheB/CheR fusion protein
LTPSKKSPKPTATTAKGRPSRKPTSAPERQGAAKQSRPVSVGRQGKSGSGSKPLPDRVNPGSRDNPTRVTVVGVGASAGGLEALTKLLKNLPGNTGLAFVLVQHLDAHHASHLSELLARATPMPVAEASHGLGVQPNRVYVMPPNSRITLAGGALNLAPREQRRQPYLPVDEFFQSLAKEQGARSIGLILSGTGADGTRGLEAIKAAGGITFAQEKASAEFDGMPHSAIAAGVVDFILPAAEIGPKLASLSQHALLNGSDQAEPKSKRHAKGADDAVRQIIALLKGQTGVDFAAYKQTTLGRRIQRRMLLAGIETLDAYAAYLHQHPAEVSSLYQDIFIHVTGFFRDNDIYTTLRRSVFPKLAQRRSGDTPVRVWAPGSATGEEAYSLAIAWLEFAEGLAQSVPMTIFATDISQAAVEKARAGHYPETISTDVSAERLSRFFVKTPGGYQIAKHVRELCVFAPHDLLEDPPFSQIDLLCCRNVLIYLEPQVQNRLLELFHYALKPGAYLVLGLSEDIGKLTHLFAPLDKKRRIFAKKTVAGRAPHVARPMRRPAGKAADEPEDTAAAEAELPGQPAVWAAADRLVMAKFAPASVVVNSDLEILQVRGHMGLFLELAPGQPTHNLQKLAREGLAYALPGLIRKAQKAHAPARQAGLRVTSNGQTRRVNLEVTPFALTPRSHELFFLVVFEDQGGTATRPAAPRGPAQARGDAGGQARATALQQELANVRESLQAVVEERDANNEELTSALEELQSANEELQTTNEELQTATEELQSTNEELTTLNEELEIRNRELGQSLGNETNLLDSLQNPVLMVGGDLRIRLFNPAAEKVVNVMATDIGRPIGEVKTRLDIPDLTPLIARVMDQLAPYQQDVQDIEGARYELRIRPYKTMENKMDGAVLTWVDISAHKANLAAMTAARNQLAAVGETVPVPLLVLDGALRVRQANRAFYEVFQVGSQATLGSLVYDLGNGQWNLPELRRLLEQTLLKKTSFEDFQVEHEFESIGQRTMLLYGRQVQADQNDEELILLAIEDITAWKQQADQLRQLSVRLQTAREEERRRLSIEVHDQLGGALTGLKIGLVRIRDGLTPAQAPLRRIAQEMVELIDGTIGTVRRIASDLRPAILDEFGLREAIAWQLAELRRLTGLACHLTTEVETLAMAPENLTAAFRVFQEVLTNIARHAQATEVEVVLEQRGETVFLRVHDNGRGITAEELSRPGSLGLIGMRERVEGLGGELDITGTPGQGTTVTVTLPLA